MAATSRSATFTGGTGTWTPGTGVTEVRVRMIGGGAPGGGSGNSGAGFVGGAAAELCDGIRYPCVPLVAINYAVGSGGTGVAGNGALGNPGQVTTFGTLRAEGAKTAASGIVGGGPGGGAASSGALPLGATGLPETQGFFGGSAGGNGGINSSVLGSRGGPAPGSAGQRGRWAARQETRTGWR